MDATKTQGLSIATRCDSIDAFVASFGRYVVDQSIFIISKKPRERDKPTPFVFTLADGTPALAGICVIRHMWMDDTNPFKQPGVWLEVSRLNAATAPVLERMQKAELSEARAAQQAAVRAKLAQEAELAKDWDPSTDSREPAMISEVVANVQRTPGAKDVLPANPLSALDDDMLDVALELGLDERAGSFEESADDAVFEQPSSATRGPAKPMPKLVSGLDVTPAVKVPRRIMPLETEAMAPLEIEKAMAEARAAAARAATPPPQSVAIPPPRFVRDTESPAIGDAPTAPLPPPEDSPELRATEAMPPLVAPAAAAPPAVKRGSAVHETTEPVARLGKRRVPLMIAAAVVVIAGALVLWKVLASSSTSADPTTATTAPTVKQADPMPSVPVDAATAPTATTVDAAAAVEPTPAPEPEPPPETGSAAGDEPKLVVASTPAGASVYVNGKRLGATPFVTTLPAGKIITVAIAKPGYQTIVRKLTAAQAKTPLRVQLVKKCTGLNCL